MKEINDKTTDGIKHLKLKLESLLQNTTWQDVLVMDKVHYGICNLIEMLEEYLRG